VATAKRIGGRFLSSYFDAISSTVPIWLCETGQLHIALTCPNALAQVTSRDFFPAFRLRTGVHDVQGPRELLCLYGPTQASVRHPAFELSTVVCCVLGTWFRRTLTIDRLTGPISLCLD